MSGAIVGLFAFGIGLLSFGFYYKLQEDIITTYLQGFILDTMFYRFSDLIWDLLPYLCIIIGVICLILSGVLSRGRRVVSYE